MGRRSGLDAYHIRRSALVYNVPYTTTIAGAKALSEAIAALQKEEWQVTPLQEYHKVRHPPLSGWLDELGCLKGS